jgi:hypothetical protein
LAGLISLLAGESAFTGDLPRFDLTNGKITAESYKILLSEKVKTVYPGHGIPYILQ